MVDASLITQLRRMIAEPTTTTYSDAVLSEIILAHPLIDSSGNFPDEDDWTATYDLNAAAADVWDEKAAGLASDYDFNADGASFSRSQAYEQASHMARKYRSRRSAVTIRLIKAPKEADSIDFTEEDDE